MTVSRAKTSARVSPPSSVCVCRIHSSRARPRGNLAMSRFGRWSSGQRTRSLLNGFKNTPTKPRPLLARQCLPNVLVLPPVRHETPLVVSQHLMVRACPANSPTVRQPNQKSVSCTSSRATRLVVLRKKLAIPTTWRSCPFVARSSMSSGLVSTKCSITPKSSR